MFQLAKEYSATGMAAYSKLQELEFASAHADGYSAIKHQTFVGTGYFDEVAQTISGGKSSTTALRGSTEEAQFAFVPGGKCAEGEVPPCGMEGQC
jgi:isocitrate lyase